MMTKRSLHYATLLLVALVLVYVIVFNSISMSLSSETAMAHSSRSSTLGIAYLLMAHNEATAQGVDQLIRFLYQPYHTFVIHYDSKMGDIDTQKYSDYPNIIILNEETGRLDVKHGTFRVVKAELALLDMAVKASTTWRYAINLCGSSMPLKHRDDIERLLKPYVGSSLIRVIKDCPEGDNTTHSCYRGAPEHPFRQPWVKSPQWAILDRGFAEQVTTDWAEKNPEFTQWKEYMEDGFGVPDEAFFSTLLVNMGFPMVDLQTMYTHFPGRGRPKCRSYPDTYDHCLNCSPCYLGMNDTRQLEESNMLFARKVRVDDPLRVHIIDTMLGGPEHAYSI